MQPNSDSASPIEPPTPTNPAEDPAVKKLQAFFCQTEQVRRESSIRLTLDGLQLYLFSDMDEVFDNNNIIYPSTHTILFSMVYQSNMFQILAVIFRPILNELALYYIITNHA
jgi:hypothetical protein